MGRDQRKESCGAIWSERGEGVYSLRKRSTVASAPTLSTGPTARGTIAFDGTDDKATYYNQHQSIKSFEGWVYLTTTTEQIIDFDGGTHYIDVSGGTVRAQGWTSPTIYVDGVAGTAITAGAWHHIAATTGTAFNATSLQLATDNSNFGAVRLCDMSAWQRVLTAAEILAIKERTTFNSELSATHRYDMSTINPTDKIGSANGTGTGVVASTDIIAGSPVGFYTEYNGTDEKTDFGDAGTVRSVALWVKPATTTEELFLVDTGKDVMVSAGTITYTGLTPEATFVNGVATTALVADTWQHVVCVFDSGEAAANFEAATDGSNFGAVGIGSIVTYSSALTNIQAADLWNRRAA